MSARRITERAELVELARELGVRGDWHEPDEQEVSATVSGGRFDNAGFWPASDVSVQRYPEVEELSVTLLRDGKPVAHVNLATLFAWATGCDDA